MLFPKKVKHRKWHKMRSNPAKARVETRGTMLSFGSYGLKAIGQARVTSNQIEAARKTISRALGKTGKLWIRIFPDMPYTQKAAEVSMGKGKGDPQGFHVGVLPGRVIFEIDGIAEVDAREALRKSATKLPMKTKFIERT